MGGGGGGGSNFVEHSASEAQTIYVSYVSVSMLEAGGAFFREQNQNRPNKPKTLLY